MEEIKDRSRTNTAREDFNEWADKIPYIHFPKNLKIKMIPPFEGAVVRFLISDLEERVTTSIYLDCYNYLGYYKSPYWEVYPYKGDVLRCDIGNIEELLDAINKSIDNQLELINKTEENDDR